MPGLKLNHVSKRGPVGYNGGKENAIDAIEANVWINI